LALVGEDRHGGDLCSLVDRRILINDNRRLAAELEADRLEITRPIVSSP
jgi:hypothetical protein